MGPCTLQRETAPASQACIRRAGEHVWPPSVYSTNENMILMPPQSVFTGVSSGLCMSRRGLLENLYTPADVAADERRSPFFFKPIVRADSNLCISLSVAFFVVLTVNHSSSMTRIRSWEQVSAMLSATSMPSNGRFQRVHGWALDWLIHFQMGVYICF